MYKENCSCKFPQFSSLSKKIIILNSYRITSIEVDQLTKQDEKILDFARIQFNSSGHTQNFELNENTQSK